MSENHKSDEPPIPAIPEREVNSCGSANASWPESSSAAVAHPEWVRLSSRYPGEVARSVEFGLDAGRPDEDVVDDLHRRNYSLAECRALVDAAIADRNQRNIFMPTSPLPRYMPLSEKQIYGFVHQQLNRDEDEESISQVLLRSGKSTVSICGILRRAGFKLLSDRVVHGRGVRVTRNVVREVIRSVSILNLSANYEPEVAHYVAERLDGEADSLEILRDLERQGFSTDEALRVVRDVEAVRTNLKSGQADVRFGRRILIAYAVLSVFTLLVGAVLGIFLFIWGARVQSLGKERMEVAERLLCS